MNVTVTSNPEHKLDLRSLSYEQLLERVRALGERDFRGRQLFRWLHRNLARSFEQMTDLPAPLRARLASEYALTTLEEDLALTSSDGTIKFRFRTADAKLIESVYMPETDRKTLCVSTQVGCAMGCTFCMTGTMGLVRNLTPGEIVDQVHRVNEKLIGLGLAGPRPLTNLVFMGMGEPLHNYDNLKVALDILQHDHGPNFSHRHITVSTSGLVPQMERLGAETEVKLAISLNASTDEQRSRIMPVNKKWNLETLLEACRRFPTRQGRRITFEYVLLQGVNDTPADAERLAKLLEGMQVKVNLIPYNVNPGLGFESVGEERAAELHDILIERGVLAVVRKNRGRDIAAACGQLVAPGGRRKDAPRASAP